MDSDHYGFRHSDVFLLKVYSGFLGYDSMFFSSVLNIFVVVSFSHFQMQCAFNYSFANHLQVPLNFYRHYLETAFDGIVRVTD